MERPSALHLSARTTHATKQQAQQKPSFLAVLPVPTCACCAVLCCAALFYTGVAVVLMGAVMMHDMAGAAYINWLLPILLFLGLVLVAGLVAEAYKSKVGRGKYQRDYKPWWLLGPWTKPWCCCEVSNTDPLDAAVCSPACRLASRSDRSRSLTLTHARPVVVAAAFDRFLVAFLCDCSWSARVCTTPTPTHTLLKAHPAPGAVAQAHPKLRSAAGETALVWTISTTAPCCDRVCTAGRHHKCILERDWVTCVGRNIKKASLLSSSSL